MSQPKTKILVLGATGMLGSMLYEYFKRQADCQVFGTVRDVSLIDPAEKDALFLFDAERDNVDASNFWECEPQFVINAIGVIKPYCKDNDMPGVRRAIVLNSLFPHLLARAAEKRDVKVIQIATDCVFSGVRGQTTETDLHDALDVYGKSKSLGEAVSMNMLHLRTSVVGPERKGKLNLLEWFLSQPDKTPIKGFSHHHWNGVTTLQFAQISHKLIRDDNFEMWRRLSPVVHYTPNQAVTKYELLKIFCEIYAREHSVENVSNVGPVVDRTLKTLYPEATGVVILQSMHQAIRELKDFTDAINFYKT